MKVTSITTVLLVITSQLLYLGNSLNVRPCPVMSHRGGGRRALAFSYGDHALPLMHFKESCRCRDSMGVSRSFGTTTTTTTIGSAAAFAVEDLNVHTDDLSQAEKNQRKLQLKEGHEQDKKDDLSSYTERTILISKIDWYMPIESVEDRIVSIFQKQTEAKYIIDLQNVRIYMAPKSNKKRDSDKEHGGRAVIHLASVADAQVAMERLMSHYDERPTKDDRFNIGDVTVQWATPKAVQKLIEMEKMMGNNNGVTPESESRMMHRKQRAEKYARQRTKIGHKTDEAIASINAYLGISDDQLKLDTLDAPTLDWSGSDAGIDPVRGGGLKNGSERGQRKHAQVEAFVHVLKEALLENKDQTVVADLGSGAGNLSLPLAWFLNEPKEEEKIDSNLDSDMKGDSSVNILAVDINKRALERLQNRASLIGKMGDVVETMVEDISNFVNLDTTQERGETSGPDPLGKCSAIVSLHACGAASDLAIAAAVQRSIPFAVSPCCIGKVKSIRRILRSDEIKARKSDHKMETLRRQTMVGMPPLSLSATERSAAPESITYPRSEALQRYETIQQDDNAHREGIHTGSDSNYNLIVNAADYNPPPNTKKLNAGGKSQSELDEQVSLQRRRGKMAKRIVETDRLKWAEEQGYHVRMMEIPRLGSHYPKREILLGAKTGSFASSRISQLSSTRLYAKQTDGDGDDGNEDLMDMNEKAMDEKSYEEKMDLGGFAGYLAPYVLALVLSVGVTAAFVKFVLLDY